MRTNWNDSVVKNKTSNILFCPFTRDRAADSATIGKCVLVNEKTHSEEYRKMKEDYEYIQQKVICEDGSCNITGTTNGPNNTIQIRTKGQGGNSKKTYAFYLTKNPVTEMLNTEGNA